MLCNMLLIESDILMITFSPNYLNFFIDSGISSAPTINEYDVPKFTNTAEMHNKQPANIFFILTPPLSFTFIEH